MKHKNNKKDRIPPFKRAFRFLRHRTYTALHRLDRSTEEAFSEEPIDFSAPSVPYYENLASRLGFARVVLYMALLVFVIVTVISNHRLITYENLYYLAKDISASTQTAHAEADRLNYPISDGSVDFAQYRGGLVSVGTEVVTVMSGAGRKTLSVNVDYADPQVRASDKYFLTFGRGENSFSLYNAFVQVHKEITEFPVYDAAVADNGAFAVLTRSRTHTSEVLLYDEGNMDEPAFICRRVGYVTGIALASDGSCLGVVSIEDQGGVFQTKISLVRIGSYITEESVVFDGAVGSLCGFTTNDRLAVLLSDRLLVLKQDATITSEISFEGRTLVQGTISGGHVAVISRDDGDLSTEYLTTYDHNGRKLAEIVLDAQHPLRLAGGADDMAFGGDTLYVRAGDTLLWMDSNRLSVIAEATVSRNTVELLPIDGDAVRVCTPVYADRLSGKKHAE